MSSDLSEYQNTVDAYVGIGSNLDDPIVHVTQAIAELSALCATGCIAHSSLYHSSPMGPADQPHYINAVVRLRTELKPLELLDELLNIERAHGRIRTAERWGPRTLDLDILLYGDRRINEPRLSVPHPGAHERAFVLYPLVEIDPEIYIPGRGTIAELISHCPRGELKRLT